MAKRKRRVQVSVEYQRAIRGGKRFIEAICQAETKRGTGMGTTPDQAKSIALAELRKQLQVPLPASEQFEIEVDDE